MNHIIERLNQFQAKQTTVIPQDIYDLINNEIEKKHLNRDDITPQLIEKILKKYRKSTFYEHRLLIYSHVKKVPPPSLTREQEELVKNFCRKAQESFKKHKPETRSNSLNCDYQLNRIFYIIGKVYNDPIMIHNSTFCKLLKRNKLREQDKMWRVICKDNSWPFFPS